MTNPEARQIAELFKDVEYCNNAEAADRRILSRAYLALEARCAKYRKALEEIALDVPPIDGDVAIVYCEENYAIARAALTDNGGQTDER